MSSKPTIRSLAASLGLSPATVSEALRDNPRVALVTRRRVRREAERSGYLANPLVGQVMSEIRRSHNSSFHGTIAAVTATEPPDPHRAQFHKDVLKGANGRARDFGYSVELFRVGPDDLSLDRLHRIMQARGIAGLVVIPFETTQDWSEFEWPYYAAVKMDYCLRNPHLHTVLPDHHVSLLRALEHLTSLGYRRIGLVMRQHRDSRILHKWTAAFHSYQQDIPDAERLPIYYHDGLQRDRFLEWMKQNRPSVVIGHNSRIVDWMAEIGVNVPEDVGFVSLNTVHDLRPVAGLNLLPELLGAAAVESVVAQLQRNERGIPAHPKTIMIEAEWQPGPTLLEESKPMVPDAGDAETVHQ